MSDKVEYEVKIEKSVKVILGAIALGLILNAFSSSIYMELFGMKDALAEFIDGSLNVSLSGFVTVY